MKDADKENNTNVIIITTLAPEDTDDGDISKNVWSGRLRPRRGGGVIKRKSSNKGKDKKNRIVLCNHCNTQVRMKEARRKYKKYLQEQGDKNNNDEDHKPVGYIDNPQLEEYIEEEVKYYQDLDYDAKVKVAEAERLIKERNANAIPTRFKILTAEMDAAAKAIAMQKYDALYYMDESMGEYHKIYNWISAVCKIPFGKYKPLPVNASSSREDIKAFLASTRDRLDAKVYGHRDAKDHLIRLLAQWVSNPDAKGLVLGIQGGMGVGKTSLVKEGICGALDIPFAFVPLGGISDASYIEGHSYTYEGAVWGKIVDLLMRCGCMNPVIFFDEVDKVSTTDKGQEIINKLIHLTDATQNDKFQDKYFTDFTFDLSRSIMIFTYNDEDAVNPILRDRMVKIRTEGYKTDDKFNIAKKHMLPEILKEFNIRYEDVVFSDTVLRAIIDTCDREEGVRNFKRALHDIISNIHYESLIYPERFVFPIHVDSSMIAKYVSKRTKDTVMLQAMYT